MKGAAELAAHDRKAIEAAPIGIICVAGAKGRYVFANAAFAHMIGRTVEEVVNGDPFQIAADATHSADRELSRQAIEHIAQGKTDRFRYDKRLVHANGTWRWSSTELVATRDGAGRLAFMTFYFTDIHEQKLAEAARESAESELRQSKKLEALGRLAGGVAHDFNNRLMVIMGYAELLKEALPEASTLASHAELVLESAERAGELTRQLLAYSKRQVLNPQALDLNAVVERMRRILARLISDDITLVTSLGASSPVLCDPGQLEQAIINLAINARDAMPRGGTLTLGTWNERLGPNHACGLPEGEYVALRVRDTGTGIAEEILPRIFEPFFTTKEVGRGTGLGLPTVQGIVQQSGGAIEVESRVGHGTTFTIYLPSAQPAAVATEAAQLPALRAEAPFETVLVCDDDDSVRQLIVNVLRLRGYDVLQARTGSQALAVAAAHGAPIHLLVTDLVMPELGGLELAAELRKRKVKPSVLYVSGYTEQASLLSGPLESGVHFLAKPFLPSDLTRCVCSILEQRAGAP